MKQFMLFASFIMVMLFVSSCQKDEAELFELPAEEDVEQLNRALSLDEEEAPMEIVPTPGIEHPEIINGRKYFSSDDALNNYMRQLNKFARERGLSADQLIPETQGREFYSAVYFFETDDSDMAVKSNNTRETYSVEEPFLELVLNQNLEVQVGEQVYRVQEDLAFSYTVGQYKQVVKYLRSGQAEELLCNTPLTRVNKYLQVQKPENWVEIIDTDEEGNTLDKQLITSDCPQKVWLVGYGARKNVRSVSFSSKRRMRAIQWETKLFFHKSAGFRTKMQKKKKKWKKIKASRLTVEGEVNVQVTISAGITFMSDYPFFETNTNVKQVHHTIFTFTGFGITASHGDITGLSGTPGEDFAIMREGTFSNHLAIYSGSTRTFDDLGWIW